MSCFTPKSAKGQSLNSYLNSVKDYRLGKASQLVQLDTYVWRVIFVKKFTTGDGKALIFYRVKFSK